MQCNRFLSEVRELANKTIEGIEDPARLRKEFVHLMQEGYPREVQLPLAYLGLIAYFLQQGPLAIIPEQRPNGAVDFSVGGLLPGYRVPEPFYLAELGSLWMILGIYQKNEALLYAGLKVAYWQSHLLDHAFLPHLSLWNFAASYAPKEFYAVHYLLFMLAYRVTSGDGFLQAAQIQKSRGWDPTSLAGKLLTLVPEKLKAPARLPYRLVTEEVTLGMLKFKAPEGSIVCSLSGRNSGVFSYHKNQTALVNAGPQMAPFDALSRFGIEREASGFHDILWEKSAHHFRLKGWTRVFDRLTWMQLQANFEAHRLTLSCHFYRPREKLFFVFYAACDRLFLGGKTVLLAGGLDHYQGKSLPIQIVTGDEKIFIEPEVAEEMQIIPLAGGVHFFGAQFLIAYSCEEDSLRFQIK